MRRTNTVNFTTFNLTLPDSATFTFTTSSLTSPNAIRITISPSSDWKMPYHWHPSEIYATVPPQAAACERLTCRSGTLQVYIAKGPDGYSQVGPAGMSLQFVPGERIAWHRPKNSAKVPLIVDLMADHVLWRNICSAILDRDIFPRLASTPWWLKALFAIVAAVPPWKNKLLSVMLWIQLQSIYFAHDFHVYHGYVGVTWPWLALPFGSRPPQWAKRLQLQSTFLIARVVMAIAYWTGTLLLGMKGEYAEYTPSDGGGVEKPWVS
ncbi:hypothetical protein DL765_006133 [Monosporascus sp. GIB2]|nr:hypothetical protein DL765_006133 [Monosporascus sp. GIB2]